MKALPKRVKEKILFIKSNTGGTLEGLHYYRLYCREWDRRRQKKKKDFDVLKTLYPNAEIAVFIEEPFWKETQ